MKIVLSHPTGNEFVRAAASGFQQANLIFEFYTSIASFSGSFFDSIGNYAPFAEIHRRRFDTGLQSITRTYPWLEICRHIALKTNFSKLTRHESGIFSIDAVYQGLDRYVALKLKKGLTKEVNAIYAYEDGALNSFIQAKHLNIKCLYDLPIGYWRSSRRLMEHERERWPDWASTLTGFNDSDAKLARKDEELRLADKIFIASQFTAKTLEDYPGTLAPVEIIPYAFPPVNNMRSYTTKFRQRPLKLLFVGSLSQRKGIADLFAAVNSIGLHHVVLTIVGHKVTDSCPVLDLELSKHKWIPTLHHHGILKLMREHDVLVFPSLFEGFGLVITEAMSQGTPVITTDRTAGPDLIKHGENGWLIEAGSTKDLILAIEELLYHPKYIWDAGKAAMETARQRPWKIYGKELAIAVHKIINTTNRY